MLSSSTLKKASMDSSRNKIYQAVHELIVALSFAKAEVELVTRESKVKSEADRKSLFIVEHDRKLVDLTKKWFN